MAGYSIDANDHLRRAIDLLLKGEVEHLLYAGLELRLGTEARQSQYANSWEHIPQRIKNDYRTTAVGKGLDRAFRIGDRILELTNHFADGSAPVSFLYTPVSQELRRVCEQLGNYLHWQGWQTAYENDPDGWTARLRDLIVSGVIHLHISLAGQLLGPALVNSQEGKRLMTLKLSLSPEEHGAKRLGSQSVGMEHMLEVQYHSIESFSVPLQLIVKDNIEALREITPAQIRHAAQPIRLAV